VPGAGVSHVSEVCAWLNSFTFTDETGESTRQPFSEIGSPTGARSMRLRQT
jgi:hypothetical protein